MRNEKPVLGMKKRRLNHFTAKVCTGQNRGELNINSFTRKPKLNDILRDNTSTTLVDR